MKHIFQNKKPFEYANFFFETKFLLKINLIEISITNVIKFP